MENRALYVNRDGILNRILHERERDSVGDENNFFLFRGERTRECDRGKRALGVNRKRTRARVADGRIKSDIDECRSRARASRSPFYRRRMRFAIINQSADLEDPISGERASFGGCLERAAAANEDRG